MPLFKIIKNGHWRFVAIKYPSIDGGVHGIDPRSCPHCGVQGEFVEAVDELACVKRLATLHEEWFRDAEHATYPLVEFVMAGTGRVYLRCDSPCDGAVTWTSAVDPVIELC